MSMTYTMKTEHGAWSSESLANAIDAVKQGMSRISVAKGFGVPISILHRHYKGNLNASSYNDSLTMTLVCIQTLTCTYNV